MTGEQVKRVFVGVPGFVAHGAPLDDAIRDAIVESFEVAPKDVQVVDMNEKFYVFINSLPFTFTTANHTVARAAQLSQTYERGVARLTKLVRRSDKCDDKLQSLRREVAELRAERDALKSTLEHARAEYEEKISMSKAVDADFVSLIGAL